MVVDIGVTDGDEIRSMSELRVLACCVSGRGGGITCIDESIIVVFVVILIR